MLKSAWNDFFTEKIFFTKSKPRSLIIVGIWIKNMYYIVFMYLFKTDILDYYSRYHIQIKIIYLYYSKIRSLKTVKNLEEVAM